MQKRVIRLFTVTVFLLMLTAVTPLRTFAASTTTSVHAPKAVTNPYSPAYQHSYRHGVVPTIAQLSKMRSYQRANQDSTATISDNTLFYGGSVDGIGVTSGKEKVYLVFWGSQWGTQSINSSGNLTFSNDPAGGAPYLQKMFKGLGTGKELWSGTMTQYCDGPLVSAGAIGCSPYALHVPYPTGGVLAGAWYDNSSAEPAAVNGDQLANEAIKAAGHFGNTTAVSNRYAQYVILSPTGTNPDNYQGGYCAWHSYNNDWMLSGGGGVPSPYGDIPFTNLPYIPDAGATCGQNYVNSGSAGKLDGYSIVEGHEYAETLTDQLSTGGWTNYSTWSEVGDECDWNPPGTPGGVGNVTMGNGTYAMQAIWSNDTDSCVLTHAIVGGQINTNDFSVSANSPDQFISQGRSSTSTVSTTVTNGSVAVVSLSATVSPAGPTVSLSPTTVTAGSSSTLTISVGPSVAPGTYTVMVKGIGASVTHSTPVTLIVTPSSGGIVNGGFETGNLSGWFTTGETSVSSTSHSGSHSVMVGTTSISGGDSTIRQTFTVPTGRKTLTFWYQVNCPDYVYFDWATATLSDSTGTTTILDPTCNTNATWAKVTASVTAGHSYTLTLISHDNDYAGDPTYTFFDDVSLS